MWAARGRRIFSWVKHNYSLFPKRLFWKLFIKLLWLKQTSVLSAQRSGACPGVPCRSLQTKEEPCAAAPSMEDQGLPLGNAQRKVHCTGTCWGKNAWCLFAFRSILSIGGNICKFLHHAGNNLVFLLVAKKKNNSVLRVYSYVCTKPQTCLFFR